MERPRQATLPLVLLTVVLENLYLKLQFLNETIMTII